MKVDEFTRAIKLVAELQAVADREIHLQKNTTAKGIEENIQLASTFSCRVSDVFGDLMDYVSSDGVE